MDRKEWINELNHRVMNAIGEYDDFIDLTVDDAKEIIKLLEEPEPIKVIIHDEDEWYGFYAQCPECGCEWMMDHEKLKYCPHCRKPVTWE